MFPFIPLELSFPRSCKKISQLFFFSFDKSFSLSGWKYYLFIMFVEGFILDTQFVNCHGNSDNLTVQIFDRHGEDAASFVSGLDVYLIIKAGILQMIKKKYIT